MATVVQDNINLFPDQMEYIKAEVEAGRMDKQRFYRNAIERAIQERKGEEKKIANFQKEQK